VDSQGLHPSSFLDNGDEGGKIIPRQDGGFLAVLEGVNIGRVQKEAILKNRDGFTNLQEYSFGTIPRQPTPALSDLRVIAASSIIDWLARPDVQYGAYSSLDLVRWGPAPFPITAAPNQAQVPAGYQRLQLELPLLDRYEEIDLFTVRIEAEASPVFNPGSPVTLTPATGEAAPGEAISLSGPEAVNAISYQWYKNDVAIPGATRRTLELPAVTADQTGSYSLMALNAAGQTRSAARFLNVRSPLPAVVTTGPVMNVTGSTALASGTVNSDGGAAVTSRGVVFSPAAQPSLLTGTPVSVTPGTGTFAAPLSPLQGKTTYYVRAFATTSAGTTYGSQVVFTTTESIPVVVTGAAVAGATFDTFTVSGDVTNDGGTPVTRRGIVYGLTSTPTLGAAMDAPSTGTGTGAFSSALTGLAPDTTYYARSYATSTIGTSYGADITFKTAATTPAGFSLISAGVFTMGDALDGIGDAPLRQVTVSAFYMAQRETTKALWDEVRAWGASRGYTDLPVGGGKTANHPVHTVSWFDIIKWCNARSEKEGLTPCYTVGGSPQRTGTATPVVNWTAKGYRLPTEAEWEKAARGGLNGKRFPWGDTLTHSQANYQSDSAYAYDISPTRGYHPTYSVGNAPYTSPVGSFAANSYGLYDMSGNVWEWCWDWSGNPDTGSPSDPRGASSGTYRVYRGGSWSNVAIHCRVADRLHNIPSNTNINLGFRVVLYADPSARTAPIVTTGAAVPGDGAGTFIVSGSVTSDGGSPVTARGVVYGLVPEPTLTSSMASPSGAGSGDFSSNLNNLVLDTTYYARAYATNVVGTRYGAEITFKTAPATPVGFALIPAGPFQMGDIFAEGATDERPVRTVNVSAFYMGKTEVTKAEWDEVRDWGVSRGYTDLAAGGGKASTHPVQTVSWGDVIKWCNARSEKDGLEPVYTVNGAVLRTGTTVPTVNWGAKGYRLPTEAEWEKAARGGLNGKRFPWSDTITHSQANYVSEIAYAYDISPTRGFHPTYAVGSQPYTSPVGSFAANVYGLHDMVGNVWEWCWDWYGPYAAGTQTDPKGSASGSLRISHGGSWNFNAPVSRVAFRRGNTPSNRNNDNGFRAVRGL
jgi:formylglycine-generating enzyme required for sulfatase activity